MGPGMNGLTTIPPRTKPGPGVNEDATSLTRQRPWPHIYKLDRGKEPGWSPFSLLPAPAPFSTRTGLPARYARMFATASR
jgi:hypothetical protein